MAEETAKDRPQGLPPGVCVPWEQKEKEFGAILGDKELVKSEWEKLDMMAYLFIWGWVHR
jgi:hypothetical protein